MAGGFGTRLKPLTNDLPKPLVPMATRPIIDPIIELLRKNSITDLSVLLYFQPDLISGHLGNGSSFGVSIQYITPTVDLGTAGAVAYAMREAGDSSSTLVISGDVLTDIDLTKAIEFHRKRKSIATIVLTRVENPLAFGIVITDTKGRIKKFLEKPGWGEVFSDTINTGIYILEKEVLDFIPKDREFDFSRDLFPALLEHKRPMFGYIAEGYWKDVGSLDEFRQANMDILKERVKFSIPGEKVKGRDIWAGKGAKIDFTSRFEGAIVVGENAVIEGEARVVNSVIGSNSIIGEGATIIDSVVWDNVRIKSGASMQEAIVGSATEIHEGAHLAEGSVVSDHCVIGRRATVKANVKVWPHKVVEDEAILSSSLVWGEKWSRHIFSTYGVTGLANLEISPEFAAKLGAAYGASLKKGSKVSTSRDAHKTSRMINRAIMTGMLSTGINVHDYGVTPMPVVRFLSRTGSETGGVHTRRSPFDQQLIDLKFFDSKGLDLHPGYEKTIEKLFFREDFARVPLEETGEMVFPVHGFEYYSNGFLSCIDADAIRKAGLKIVLDYSFGSSTRIFPSILGGLNIEVISLNANLDGERITRSSEEFQRSIETLSSIVKSLKAHAGFLLDAGGEKVFMVDDTGEALEGDTALNVMALLALKCQRDSMGKAAGGAIAVPVTASRAIDIVAEKHGFAVKRTKTSARGLMEASTEEGIFFVGEQTGGFIFPKFQPNFDGMYAIVKSLEMLAKQRTTLSRLAGEVPQSIILKEKVTCPFERKGMIMRRLAEDARLEDTLLLDGIRINFGADWLVAFPSQDHPYFHVVAESSSENGAKSLISTYADKIKRWQR